MPDTIRESRKRCWHSMAGVAPERAVTKRTVDRRVGGRTAPLLRVTRQDWLPPLILTIATFLIIAAAYTVRPFVSIDLGDYYDSAYIDVGEFNGREVGADGPSTSIPWPTTQNEFTIPGNRTGLWMATLYAVPGQSDALEFVSLAANGEYLNIVRPTVTDPRTGAARMDYTRLIALIPPDVGAADQLNLKLVPALRDEDPPPTGLVERIELARARTYRWSQGESSIHLPGLGRGDWQVSLTALVQHPDNAPLDATITANGTPIARLPERGELRRLSFVIPAERMPNGDLTLGITSQTFEDPRPLGVLIQEVSLSPIGQGTALPPLSSLLYALIVALATYFCLLRMLWRRVLAVGLALAVLLAGAWFLTTARYPTVFMLPRVALLLLWSVGLLLVLERVVTWTFRRAGVPISQPTLVALLLTFFVGYWIKSVGMLYPYFIGVDIGWHLDRAREILNGQLAQFYGINSPLNEWTMPTAEWGADPPVIPYSPWFHMFATLFTFMPIGASLAANLFSALVDVSRVFLIALLGRKGGLNERESLLAAILYAITPVTFLLHSWANLPTTFGLWWTLLVTLFIVVAYRRLDQPWPFVILTLLLVPTLLVYTVTAVFMLLFLGALVPLLWALESAKTRKVDSAKKREEPQRNRIEEDKKRHNDDTSQPQLTMPRQNNSDLLRVPSHAFADSPSRAFADHIGVRPVVAIMLAGLAALGLTTLIYYGQYIAPILERTAPYFTRAAGGDGTGIEYPPFSIYLAQYWPRMSYFDLDTNAYGLQLTLPIGLLGMFVFRNWRMRAIFVAWLLVALLFLVAGSRISMVDKHLFYLIPALVLGCGLIFGRLWRRGVASRLVVAGIYVATFVAALQLWVHRIVSVQQ